jgi:NADH-quinone oxidoreductase subunit L
VENAWILNGLGTVKQLHSMIIPVISTIMVIIGMAIAYLLYKPSGEKVMEYANAPNSVYFWQSLSYNNWHLDKIYKLTFVRLFIRIANISHIIEMRVVDKTVDYFGVFNVVLGKVIGWIDANIVDGFVEFLVKIGSVVGFFTKSIQTGRAQSQIVLGVLGLMAILGWVLFF